MFTGRKGLHLVTGPYLYTHAPEGLAYLPKRWACTLPGGETLRYEPVCMLLNKLAPP